MVARVNACAVELVRGTSQAEELGLLGWVRVRVLGLEFDGIALRRSREGRIYLSFPSRRDRAGNRHYVVRPTSEQTRVAFEAMVLDELRRQGDLD